ncbi:MAG: Crp/Fnr family transcriptional regulator [Mogibacterium sp.]|nr:Crp/Fnr family transcriptional regulator [Mogibacterium sp.]
MGANINFEEIYPFFNKLNDTERDYFTRGTRLREFSAGDLIHQPEIKCEGIIYMLSGTLRVYMLSDDGREITLFRQGPGEHCVLSASCVIDAISFEVFIESETDTTMYITDAPVVRKVSDSNPYLNIFTQELALEDFSVIMWTLQQVLFFSVDRRIAGFLLKESEKTGGNIVKATHEQIASSIGSAREVVSRMLKRFEEDGYIKLSRGSVEILDRESLEDIT